MNDIIKLATQLGDMLKNSQQFNDYQEVKARYETDSELQMLIGEFNLRKMAVMNEMQNEEGRDEKKFELLQQQMRESYAAAMANPLMKEFNQKKEKFENMVNEVYSVINYEITGQDGGCDKSKCASCGGGCHD